MAVGGSTRAAGPQLLAFLDRDSCSHNPCFSVSVLALRRKAPPGQAGEIARGPQQREGEGDREKRERDRTASFSRCLQLPYGHQPSYFQVLFRSVAPAACSSGLLGAAHLAVLHSVESSNRRTRVRQQGVRGNACRRCCLCRSCAWEGATRTGRGHSHWDAAWGSAPAPAAPHGQRFSMHTRPRSARAGAGDRGREGPS